MIVVFGASGNTGKLISEHLLSAGRKVRAVSRNPGNIANLVAACAEAAIGDVEDAVFVAKALDGAEATYLIIPPKFDIADWTKYQTKVLENFVAGISASGVKKVVVLSSQGAHLPDAGPVTALGVLEERLKEIEGIDVVALRAGYFMENFYAMAGMIKHMNILGSGIKADAKVAIVHTRDIAAVAVKHLLNLSFSGHTVEYVAGAAEYTMPEVASILGGAIGKPDLAYVPFSLADARAGLLGAGLPDTIANGYVQLFNAINRGDYYGGYVRTAANTTPTLLEQFAIEEWAHAYPNL
jgi:uncharacterized protein YbjT (DUF2867 family)